MHSRLLFLPEIGLFKLLALSTLFGGQDAVNLLLVDGLAIIIVK
jgi:hypothetical protein